ncbi:protein NO VEIN domain-containing protein [Lysobacter antibioticus]|uniref:protein NO VEIN domain-containing protein n=1 Tax=Lysobacter antibioticus TaxID=84531 RepID=UPI0009A236B0|nr:DUF3883 domain-containing protein [Lysobacter antibioticus]
MTRKLALKRLTASDLTLFKWHFKNRPAGKQKAFNLDARILVDGLYPVLKTISNVPFPRYPLNLHLFGPGLSPAINLQRKILKQEKNWRLNGELIDNPEESPERFNVLAPGDFAFIEFSGDQVPDSASVVLVAKGHSSDEIIHAELDRKFPAGSMWLIKTSVVSEILEACATPESHPLYDWVEGETVEEAVLGGAAGIEKINKRRAGRGISPEDFLRYRQSAEQNGVTGERLLNDYYERQVEAGELEGFEWTSSINAISPFDFRMRVSGAGTRLVEVKSTSGNFGTSIHISFGELYHAAHGGVPYDVVRIYNVTDGAAKFRIARDCGAAFEAILQALEALPTGVGVDAISIRPDMLPFSKEEISLEFPVENDVEAARAD